MSLDILNLIQGAIGHIATDLHIVAELPPMIRVGGDLRALEGNERLTPQQTQTLIYGLLNGEQRAQFERDKKISISTRIGPSQLRISVFYHTTYIGAAIRLPSLSIMGMAELGLPKVLGDLIRKPTGLILVTGPINAGKTTTMNAMIDQINQERKCKIVTVEDPIEYLHKPKRSIIVQQEIGSDALNFKEALSHILRQDANVICIGEMRDLETIAIALEAAETGQLVVGTLHTSDAAQTIDRIVNIFPPQDRPFISGQVAACLQGIVSQRLLPTLDSARRVLASEILIANEAARNIIREAKIQSLPNVIMTSVGSGMQTMDMSLKNLVERGLVASNVAVALAKNPKYVLGQS